MALHSGYVRYSAADQAEEVSLRCLSACTAHLLELRVWVAARVLMSLDKLSLGRSNRLMSKWVVVEVVDRHMGNKKAEVAEKVEKEGLKGNSSLRKCGAVADSVQLVSEEKKVALGSSSRTNDLMYSKQMDRLNWTFSVSFPPVKAFVIFPLP